MSDTSGLRAPLSADPASLQRWGFELVTRLRQRAEEGDESATNALQEIVNTYGTITNFGDLSDSEKAALGLSQAVADQLAIDDVLAEIQPFLDSPGKAAVYAYLRAHQNEASVRVEQTVRETETLSLSNQVTSLTADLADTDAALVVEQTARATGDSALSSQITSLTSTVAGNTTTITEHTAAIDGIEAEWGVTINAQGQVVGLVRLDADQSESTFTVVVDKFQVAQTDGTGIVPIFQVGNVNGSPRVALAADMLIDGYIAAQAIAAGAITTAKLAASAVTADEIAANAVTAAKLNVSDLSAISADLGTVTAGVLQSADGNFVIDLDNKTITIET